MENTPGGPSLRPSMTRQMLRHSTATGEIRLPAVPGMLDEYVTICRDLFASFGVRFSPEELLGLRGILEHELAQAYGASSRSEIVISYDAPAGTTADYRVAPRWLTIEETYANWVATREPPYFGTEPDARVMALAAQTGEATACPVLDVGAGTGRNSLALARRGHRVDAVEMTEKFAGLIGEQARQENLDVRVLQRDVFEGIGDLRNDYGLIVLSEVVSDFRNTDQLRQLFELSANCLAPGGYLIFNAFLPRDGYTPDDAARQLGQQLYTSIFTHGELAAACSGLALYLVDEDSVYDYEKAHQPESSWPPTSWYGDWVNGRDVFDVPAEQSPIGMRWLVYRKPG